MKMNYSYNEMKRAFECGRNFQLTGENNFQELIEELNRALRQPLVIGSVCPCGRCLDEVDIQFKQCYECGRYWGQTDL
jgi:hypothetical protein